LSAENDWFIVVVCRIVICGKNVDNFQPCLRFLSLYMCISEHDRCT